MNLHIVKYAKGHYGYSKDPMNDLKNVISNYSGVHYEGLNDRDVLECVSDVWFKVARPFDRERFNVNIFCNNGSKYDGTTTLQIVIAEMLSNMRYVSIDQFQYGLPKNVPSMWFGTQDNFFAFKSRFPMFFEE